MTDTAARLAALERKLLGSSVITEEDRKPPNGVSCPLCGLALATVADHEGRCWFPSEVNGPDSICLECHEDAHELGHSEAEWRHPSEHRDLVVSRLAGRTGTEPGIADQVGWRWFHELTGADRREPAPQRFGWVDRDQLRQLADPPEHVCTEECMPAHQRLPSVFGRPEPEKSYPDDLGEWYQISGRQSSVVWPGREM